MRKIDYQAVVRILSFNVQGIPRDARKAPSNPPIDTTLAAAIRLVCSDEWKSAGNMLGVILQGDGPPILDLEQARAIMRDPDFPRSL